MSQHPPFGNASHSLQLNLNIKEGDDPYEKEELGVVGEQQNAVPSVCGMPLKYVSLVTLAVQNAMLTLIMHYSRVSSAPSQTYSAAAAVLMTELLKGSISLFVAFMRVDSYSPQYIPTTSAPFTISSLFNRFRRLGKEVFRPDCWKLSIPAILYVIQNNLQFVAISNLDAATFQVSYQMKILTTAAFSVVLLRKKLSPTKWLALFFLAVGVGIVQIQSGSGKGSLTIHSDMNAFKGFMAVVAACFTSGLAGVYFEMVLKNSPGDLWVRNVQLSLFSLLPALVPIVFSKDGTPNSSGLFSTSLFANFTVWAWATVFTQVLGGLLTALVIKYADNILKGFATSLSIVISFLASVALFNFEMTITFILGSTVVLVATWMYNQPESSCTGGRQAKPWTWHWRRPSFSFSRSVSAVEIAGGTLSRRPSTSSLSSLASFTASRTPSFPSSPVERDAPMLGQLSDNNTMAKKAEQGRLFGLMPFKKAITSRIGLFRSASFAAIQPPEPPFPPYSTPAFVTPSTASLSTYPPLGSRPVSGTASYPTTRPPSALGGSVLDGTHSTS